MITFIPKVPKNENQENISKNPKKFKQKNAILYFIFITRLIFN